MILLIGLYGVKQIFFICLAFFGHGNHRFIGFFRGLVDSPSYEVVVVARLAARDVRSNLGANLALVKTQTGLDPWMAVMGQLRAALDRADRVAVPQADSWRVAYLRKLLAQRLQAHYSANKHEEE